MGIQAFDLDGTLAEVNFAQAGVRGLARIFAQAKVLFKPTGPFTVITARAHGTDAVRRATYKWLSDNFNGFVSIHYCNGKSEAEIIQDKARIIKAHNVTSFTDNNPKILDELKKITTGVTFYRAYADGTRKQY
jgi:hypothetical protein